MADGLCSLSQLEVTGGVGARAQGEDGPAAKKPAQAATPSSGLIDSQSGKPQEGSEERGREGHTRLKGRKRPIVVETLGTLLPVQVHAAHQADTTAGCTGLERTAMKYPTGAACCGAPGYRGTAVTFGHEHLALVLHLAPRLGEGVVGQPTRWIGERTFAWLGHFRRLAKDVEILTGTAENVLRIALLKITLAKC